MPQANITYDAPYNRSMVNLIREMDEKHWQKAYPAYHPNPMGFRSGSYHQPVSSVKIGGGSSPLKYNPSGNSPAYPPLSLSQGLAVNSGGARYSGIDGAIGHPALSGGSGLNPFDLGYSFGHDILGPALFGRGRPPRGRAKSGGAKSGGAKSGGKFNFLGAIKNIGHALGEPVGLATEQLAKAELSKAVGLGRKTRKPSARAVIVKKVMKEKGLGMIEASKYVKAHGLY